MSSAWRWAHCECEPDPRLGRLLITGSTRAILDAVSGRRPAGLKSALNRLAGRVLSRKEYPQLLDLLDDPTVAKLLYNRAVLTGKHIAAVHALPKLSRRIVALATDQGVLQKPKGVVDGLEVPRRGLR